MINAFSYLRQRAKSCLESMEGFFFSGNPSYSVRQALDSSHYYEIKRELFGPLVFGDVDEDEDFLYFINDQSHTCHQGQHDAVFILGPKAPFSNRSLININSNRYYYFLVPKTLEMAQDMVIRICRASCFCSLGLVLLNLSRLPADVDAQSPMNCGMAHFNREKILRQTIENIAFLCHQHSVHLAVIDNSQILGAKNSALLRRIFLRFDP